MQRTDWAKRRPGSQDACEHFLRRHFDLVAQYSGDTTHLVQSDPSDAAGFNSKGAGMIGFHNDAYDYPELPAFVALYCVEADCDGGETFHADFCTALMGLSPDARALLLAQRLEFHTEPARFFKTPGVGLTAGIFDAGVLRFSDGYMRRQRVDAAVLEALDRLDGLLHAQRQGVTLAPGELVLLDNRALVHGRTAFTGRRTLVRYWLRERAGLGVDLAQWHEAG